MNAYGMEEDDAASTAGGCADGTGEAGGDGAGGAGSSAGAAEEEPREGMEFGSYNEAAAFYYGYARREGFRVSKKSSRRSKLDNCFVEVKFVCSRYGKKHEKPQALYRRRSGKVECQAAMFVRKREGSTRWFVYYLVKEHNHELARQQQRQRIPGSLGGLGAPVGDDGGRIPRSAEDAQHLFEFLTRMQEENPGFFYALGLDEDERLKNVFWVDAKGRLDYATFGDAVSFHTECITDKYRLPVLTILGVNNHGKPALFGCALLANEETSTFVWLMETWIRAVGGQAPKAITTNHHEAIKAAVKHVFPGCKHRFCILHIRKKALDELGVHAIEQHNNLMHMFDKCLYMSLTEEEFSRRWLKMISKFELHDCEYLQLLHEDRCHWVPLYLRDTYFGEMPSLQSESVNLYNFFSENSTLKDFLEQYEVDLQDCCEKESVEYCPSLNTGLQLKSQSPYVLQVSLLHTRYAFEKFQAEVMKTCVCNVIEEQEDESGITCCVNDLEEGKEFMVSWNRTKSRVFCSCCSFEFKGYLCRHAIVVLQLAGVPKAPSHYILARWMRDARTCLTLSQRPTSRMQSWLQRYNDLCNQATRLAYECLTSEESYSVSWNALEEAIAKCIEANTSSPGNSDPNPSTSHIFGSIIKKRKY